MNNNTIQHLLEDISHAQLAEFYARMTGLFDRGISPLASDRSREADEAYEYGCLAAHHARLAIETAVA